jgi:hypothetical protein
MGSASRFGVSLTAVMGLAAATASGQATLRESVDSSGNQGDNNSYVSGLSGNGRYIAFYSDATNLVPGDTNLKTDCFVRDRVTGTVTIVSVRSNGVIGNGPRSSPYVNADGTLTTFHSDARNLVNLDGNLTTDVFVHDSVTGKTTRVSVDSGGLEANGASTLPQISADGMIVAYQSMATNLVAGDTNGVSDIFVFDRTTAITTRVSVDSSGMQGNGGSYSARLSANGQFVFFYSDATNLVAGDTNAATDGFVHDLSTGMTERVTVDSSGNQGNGISYNGTITADGSVVAFYSLATNLVPGDNNAQADVFIHDRNTGTTTRVSTDSSGGQGNGGSYTARISPDGKFVAFASDATNLVPGDTNALTDIFQKDLTTGATVRLSVDSSGVQSNGSSSLGWSSDDGRFVAFNSTATNLVSGDTNGFNDVFLRDSGSPASWSNYDAGWPGTYGVPSLTSSANPVFGTTITITLTDSTGTGTTAMLLIGLGRANLPSGKDGTILVSPFLFVPLALPPGGIGLNGTLPGFDSNLCGVAIDLQGIEVDAGASKGLSFTAGLELILGI